MQMAPIGHLWEERCFRGLIVVSSWKHKACSCSTSGSPGNAMALSCSGFEHCRLHTFWSVVGDDVSFSSLSLGTIKTHVDTLKNQRRPQKKNYTQKASGLKCRFRTKHPNRKRNNLRTERYYESEQMFVKLPCAHVCLWAAHASTWPPLQCMGRTCTRGWIARRHWTTGAHARRSHSLCRHSCHQPWRYTVGLGYLGHGHPWPLHICARPLAEVCGCHGGPLHPRWAPYPSGQTHPGAPHPQCWQPMNVPGGRWLPAAPASQPRCTPDPGWSRRTGCSIANSRPCSGMPPCRTALPSSTGRCMRRAGACSR